MKIAVIPGDGIGKEVMEAALHVLGELDLEPEFLYAEAGDECLESRGTALPDETIEIIGEADATLFGAAGESAADVIVKLRREFDLFANLRPVKSLPGVPCLYPDLDFVIVRENTEDLYVGDEEFTADGAVARRIITRRASRRISRFAFEYARREGWSRVTAVHKANVLKKTDGVFREEFYRVASDYPEMEAEDYYVDATAMYLITQPQEFQVLVTTNLFGDILSDEAAGLIGGLGLAPSANIGEKNAIFEPVHGSAPQIAGKNIANPTAMILTTTLMLKHLNKTPEAHKIQKALEKTLEAGLVTPDLGGSLGTMEMAAEIAKRIEG
ncbi:3-isopropylmalate dehydrogenase [Methanothermobacter sp. K4]|uniref:3-isopropylmalate dehydrogenase n=1 Tax=Methanothermobacter sp. K4 TaxID=2913262 RepID=UPI001EDBABBB|nr:3-isopropylmalate dehydrogenase [Methanothermobacter sp. K4]MCG2827971.1 3-isopropylmalate dehydrogenase [Methanothermobacter sp. K4]